jgi:hypothetical protein
VIFQSSQTITSTYFNIFDFPKIGKVRDVTKGKEETGTGVSSLRQENPSKEDLGGRDRGVGTQPKPRPRRWRTQIDATAGGNRGDRLGEVWLGRGRDRRWPETGRKRTMEIELARGRKGNTIGGGERPWRCWWSTRRPRQLFMN